MRTIIYIDGFNLYYRLLRKKPDLKWLNLNALSKNILDTENDIIEVKYYTARVTGRVNPDTPRKQQIYLKALSTDPSVSVHMGSFQVNKKLMGLVHPPKFRPPTDIPEPWPRVVKVINTEEKGSDVNLASHLLFDAFKDNFDVGVVLSNDSDLVEPIRLVTSELNKTVGLLSPSGRPNAKLSEFASFVKHIREPHLRNSQFENEIHHNGEVIKNPWADSDL